MASILLFILVIAASFVSFTTTFSSMIVYSFQPFMVNWFFPDLAKEELGWRTGYLGMSYYIGSFFGGLFWGWLADNLGRRPSLLIGLIGSIIFGTLFGLSQTYEWALFGRLGCGFAGSVGFVVVKTYISEKIAEKDQPRAFSMFGLSIGFGRIFGPVAGGFLAQPATKYDIFDIEFFCSYPFILPQLLTAFFQIVCFIGVYFLFEETLKATPHRKNKSIVPKEYKRHQDTSDSSSTDDEEWTELTSVHSIDLNKLDNNGCCASTYRHIVTVQRDQLTCLSNCISGLKCKRSNPDSDPPPPLKERLFFIMRAIINRSVLSSIAVYIVLGSVGMMIFEVFTLLIISNKEHGGYDMNEDSIGFCFLVAGIVELLYQLLIYARLVKLLGWRKLLIGGVILFAVATFVFPWGSSIPIKNIVDFPSHQEDQNETIYFCGGNSSISVDTNTSLDIGQQPYLVWIIVLVPFVFLMIGRMTTLITSSVLLNNSSIPETRGTVNGIGYSLASLLRAVGYALAAILFAWSQNNGKGWPLNYHFSFILLSILLMTTIPILLSLPKSMETTKKS